MRRHWQIWAKPAPFSGLLSTYLRVCVAICRSCVSVLVCEFVVVVVCSWSHPSVSDIRCFYRCGASLTPVPIACLLCTSPPRRLPRSHHAILFPLLFHPLNSFDCAFCYSSINREGRIAELSWVGGSMLSAFRDEYCGRSMNALVTLPSNLSILSPF